MLDMVPVRYVFAFMGFLGSFSAYLLKANLSVAIVDMVDFEAKANNTEDQQSNLIPNDTSILVCPDRGAAAEKNSTVNKSETKFVWNESLQGLILGSNSYGSIVGLFAVAYASRRFGHVRVLGVSMLTSSIATILIPAVTEAGGFIGLVLMTVVVGMFSGAASTVLLGLVGKWSPPQERSKIVAIIFAGNPVGTSCAMPIAGLLAGALGWKSVFYVSGACTAVWALLWLALIHETPEQHPRITESEKNLIINSLRNVKTEIKKPPVPWKKIFKSRAFLSLVIAHAATMYGRSTPASMLPTYLKTVLQFNVQMAGVFSAIPYMATGMFLIFTGPLADFIISKGVRTIIVRKAFTATGMLSSGAALIAAGYSGCDVALSIFLFTAAVAMDTLCIPGFRPCYAEIAPEYCGVLYGISSTVAAATDIVAPQIAGSLRQAYGALGWKIAFWIAGTIYFLACAQFLVFGTNEIQPWAVPKKTRRPSVATVAYVIEDDTGV